jgi:hypothetical protein
MPPAPCDSLPLKIRTSCNFSRQISYHVLNTVHTEFIHAGLRWEVGGDMLTLHGSVKLGLTRALQIGRSVSDIRGHSGVRPGGCAACLLEYPQLADEARKSLFWFFPLSVPGLLSPGRLGSSLAPGLRSTLLEPRKSSGARGFHL